MSTTLSGTTDLSWYVEHGCLDRAVATLIRLVDPNPTAAGCFLWNGQLDRKGYGLLPVVVGMGSRTRIAQKTIGAHRFAYLLLRGPIPNPLVLDHLCRTRGCVNPLHLEAVTQAENLRRSPLTSQNVLAAKTHCKHGHPFDEANTVWRRGGGRGCRACQVAAGERMLERRRQMGRFCSESGCGEPEYSQGLCRRHYTIWYHRRRYQLNRDAILASRRERYRQRKEAEAVARECLDAIGDTP